MKKAEHVKIAKGSMNNSIQKEEVAKLENLKLDIMVAKNKNKEKNWESLVKSLEKRLNEEKKSKKQEPLTAVEVICSHEDIERTRQG